MHPHAHAHTYMRERHTHRETERETGLGGLGWVGLGRQCTDIGCVGDMQAQPDGF